MDYACNPTRSNFIPTWNRRNENSVSSNPQTSPHRTHRKESILFITPPPERKVQKMVHIRY